MYAPCAYCGARFAKKLDTAPTPIPRAAGLTTRKVRMPPRVVEHWADHRIRAQELIILGVGFAAAAVLYLVPFTRAIVRAIVGMLHQAGQCLAGWIVGIPTIPFITFSYPTRGMTFSPGFWIVPALGVAAAIAYALFLVRRSRLGMTAVIVFAAIWLLFVTGPARRAVFYSIGGHLVEAIVATMFFNRAMRGSSRRLPVMDPRLEAFAGAAIVTTQAVFAFHLLADRTYRASFALDSVGNLPAVSHILKGAMGFSPGIPLLALLLLFVSLTPVVTALLLHRFRSSVRSVLRDVIELPA